MNFCVKCGVDCEDTIRGLCIECFLGDRTLTALPHHVDLETCASCGEFFIHDEWVEKEKIQAIEDAAIENLDILKEAEILEVTATSIIEQDISNFAVTIGTSLKVGSVYTTDSADTVVRVKNSVCKKCSRQLGSYYESILQIRNGEKDLSYELKDETLSKVQRYVNFRAKTDKQIFITKTEIVVGGLDVYLSSIQLGKSLSKFLADDYCAVRTESPKLVGQTDDGQDMYRVTYLVRLPDYHVGDVVIFDKRYYKLTRVANVGAKMIDLMHFGDRSVKRQDMSNIKVYRKEQDFGEATVVSRMPGEIQVMNPSNYSTVDLKIPAGANIGEVVHVVDINEALYYVP